MKALRCLTRGAFAVSSDHPDLPQSSDLTCAREGRGVEVADAPGARGDLAGDHRALGAQPDVLPLFTAPSVTCTRQLQGARTAPDLVISSETERDRVRSTEAFPAPPTLPNPPLAPQPPPGEGPSACASALAWGIPRPTAIRIQIKNTFTTRPHNEVRGAARVQHLNPRGENLS